MQAIRVLPGRLTSRAAVAASALAVVVLALLDHTSPAPVSFTVFYMLACMLAGWTAGQGWGFLMALLTMAALGTEELTRSSDPLWVIGWNSLSRLTVCSLAATMASRLAGLKRGLERTVAERTAVLQASEERHRQLLEILPDSCVVTDREGRITSVNQRALELHGLARAEEILGRSAVEFVSPAEAAKLHDRLRRVAEGETLPPADYLLRRADGGTFPAEVNTAALRDATGRLEGFITIGRDCTARRRTEQAVRDNEARLRLALDAAGMVTWEWDVAQGTLRYSPNASALAKGEDLEPYCTLAGILERLHPDDRDRVRAALDRTLHEGRPFECEYRLQMLDGRYYWVLGRGDIVETDAGKPTRLRGVSLDITQRQQAEQTRRLQARVLESVSDAVALCDGGGCLTLTNPAMEALFGCGPGELLGRHIDALSTASAERIAAVKAELFAEIERRGQWAGESHGRARDGRDFLCELRISGLELGGTRHFVLVFHDVTERRHAEQALQTQARVLENMNEGVVLADESGRIRLTNPALDAMFGYARGELAGAAFDGLAFRKTDEGTQFFLNFAARVRAQGPAVEELECRTKTGARLRVVMRFSELQLDGRFGLVAVVQDVTERRRAEETLRLQALVLQGMAEAVIVADDTGTIVLANRAAERLWGYGSGVLPGRHVSSLSARPDGPTAQRHEEIMRAVRSTGQWQGRLLIRCADGSPHPTEAVLSGLQRAGRPLVVGVLQDLTERDRLEGEILAISDAEKTRIGQELHDGLCQALVGAAFQGRALERALARHQADELPRVSRLCEILDEAITESRRLARGLFPVKLETFGLTAALQELAVVAQEQSGIACGFTCSDPGLQVADHAAATHLYRIAQEGVNNALRHSGATRVNVTLEAHGGELCLCVGDDGKGLPPGAHSAGMGLHTMEYRARALGGALRLTPRPGGGTEVCCCVPWPPA